MKTLGQPMSAVISATNCALTLKMAAAADLTAALVASSPELSRCTERNRTGERFPFEVRRSVLSETGFKGTAGKAAIEGSDFYSPPLGRE